MFQRMLSENHRDRNIACVASSSDQNTADAPGVMSGIESMPVRAQVNFEPGAEIHWIGVGRNTDITEIACCVARRDIHAAAQSNRQMRKVTAHADALVK